MNILWITNALLPEAMAKLKGASELKDTGGWVLALAEALRQKADISISVAAITPLVKKLTLVQGEHITYFAIPFLGNENKYNKAYETVYTEICGHIQPDVVHIHGTEYPHALAALRACGVRRTVVSLQGMVSAIAPYYMGGISAREARRNMTFRSLLRPSLMREQKDMVQRGGYEIQTLREARYVIGRTSWDKSHTWVINPQTQYFHCGEALRHEFYEGRWNYDLCQPHTVFASQAGYPLKGLHMLIDAMGIVARQYPDVMLRVAGHDITYGNGSFVDRLRISTYGKIIKKRIERNGLVGHVAFIGPQNAEQMKQEYLKANVFVCPSSIENSPNSLGEAQILGVPCLASYVGGAMDMMRGDEDHLYRFEETGMLASKICSVFEKKEAATTEGMRQEAMRRHNPDTVVGDVLKVYEIVKTNNN